MNKIIIYFYKIFLYKNILNMNKPNFFKTQACSPFKELDFTCYSTKSLINIKNKWNKKHPSMSISSKDPYIIWNKLKYLLSNVCDNEKCWLRQQFIKNNVDSNLLSYTFAPDRPSTWDKNNNEWLDSNNILNVMKQYEKKYNNFRFLGPSPINYDYLIYDNECVWNELCNFNLFEYLKNGVTKIGIIFNTDPHNKSGEHWVSLFINIESTTPYIFYFDSTGDKILSKIKKFSNNVIKQAKQFNINLKYIDNHNIKHQKGNSECGMYSLYFIIQLLTDNNDYNHFLDNNNKIPDKFVEKYRHIYFN